MPKPRISPAMLALLRRMDAEERRGRVLGRLVSFRWCRGSDWEPTTGVSIATVGALIRRKLIRYEPAPWGKPTLYRLTLAGQKAAEQTDA